MKTYEIVKVVTEKERRGHVCYLPGSIRRAFKKMSVGSLVKCTECNQLYRLNYSGYSECWSWEKVVQT